MFQRKFSVRSSVGFSIPELMVVIIIIGILASLAMPRLRAFIARSRQAEAKNLLSQIHTLQQTHQNFKDKFASWASGATGVGKGGLCGALIVASTTNVCLGYTGNTAPASSSACTTAGGIWAANTPGAYELGFKPQNCNQLRYNYWVEKAVDATTGKEHYIAYAYSNSDPDSRIYPTCNGDKGSRSDEIKHPVTGVATKITHTVTKGDLQAVDEDKTSYHSDIIPNCE